MPAAAHTKEVLPGLQLDSFPTSQPAAKTSFHVKQDTSPRGREIDALRQASSKATRLLASTVLDTLLTLCDDGILERPQWEKTLVDLANIADLGDDAENA